MSSERRNHLILVALILVALIGAAAIALPWSPAQRKPVLGLDLQGGLEVVLKAVPERGETLEQADLDRSVEIIRSRVDKIGVAEPEIRTQGSDQIAVELPGVRNADQARQVIGQTAQLELYDLQPALVGPSSAGPQGFPAQPPSRLYDLLSAAATQSLVRENGAEAYYLFLEEDKRLLAGPLPTREALLATDAAQEAGAAEGDVPDELKVFAVPSGTVVITCGTRGDFCPGVGEVFGNQRHYYLFKHDPDAEQPVPQMRGDDLELSGTRADFDPTTSEPIVLMQFTDAGARKFHEITRAEAQRGRNLYSISGGQGDPRNYNQNFAIVLDRELITAPSIDFQQYPDGIPGNNGAQITGIGSLEEAQQIALVLQTGALPVRFATQSETQISATLGEDSLRQAAKAAAAGLIVVALFLLTLYRFLGLVAVIGLGIYSMFVYAAILLFNVTLTLPGFAGLVLTIGIAADANIVIFERIKEEFRAGKSIRAAIATGYQRGFHTIVDANAVTAITAVILFVLATAGVKGFALMLLVGIVISMITAIFATRAMLGLLSGFRWFNSPRFLGAHGQQRAKWMEIDFVGKRRIWYTISIVAIVASCLALSFKGLNLGIDFRGGTQLSFSTSEPTRVGEVRTAAGELGFGEAQIRGIGSQVSGGYREFQIRTEALEGAEATQLRQALEQDVRAQDFGTTTVSASFGSQIAKSAIYAILFSLLLITLYIWIRFEWKFSLPVMRAIFHDIIITLGIYALTGRQMTSATVAALLTILGYSIYDTIIVFDRVRENIPLMRRAPIEQIVNTSLWEVMRRSLATTFSTLLPVGALFFFGGETLKDFAFALMVGIGTGAYGSIFIAAPLLATLKRREPEFARRSETVAGKDAEVEAAEIPGEPVTVGGDGGGPAAAVPLPAEKAASKRERRRQRRRTRPHGRAR
ncbi:MAG: protein translocase subunit SecD [Thermoleophilia bacterium]|nr:protein translocase subunit SecD [Thermoleophilia bacterium]